MHHGAGEDICVLLAAKVEAVDLPGVTPLVKGECSLIVLEALWDGTVDYNLETQEQELKRS